MRVLTITGDKRFGPGHERYELMRSAVDELAVIYWGRDALFPKMPQGSFDVVTAQDPLGRGLFGLYAAWRKKAQFNVQVHMDLESLQGFRRALARFVLGRADSVRAVSEKIKSQAGKLGARAGVAVLPLYIDIERFKALKPEPHEGKVVLWVGRFENEKDPLLALEVFKKIRARGTEASFVMLGTGSLEMRLKEAAAGSPVSFPGWQDPLSYLAQADVVLSTSKYESWGASMVEALAAGVPVVAPEVGIAREAGATVVSLDMLDQACVQILQLGMRGQLTVNLLSEEEWVKRWKETLV
ncbi:MAG: glycosyltransferase [Candidatus Adlerbacteria bacterium]|nr:glycosyltransferase [Candidatus Adlerbacteria bacterium]